MKKTKIALSLVAALAVGSAHAVTGPVVIEFYNSILDNYFITADAGEAAAIDSGSAGAGWNRTGLSFNNNQGSKEAVPVCRFYGSQYPGPNSHFYTASTGECDQLKKNQFGTGDPRKLTDKSWNFENLDFLSSALTTIGNPYAPPGSPCVNTTVPVYRAYNNGFARGIDSNHRITTSKAAIDAVVAKGWIDEGVVMCAPDGVPVTEYVYKQAPNEATPDGNSVFNFTAATYWNTVPGQTTRLVIMRTGDLEQFSWICIYAQPNPNIPGYTKGHGFLVTFYPGVEKQDFLIDTFANSAQTGTQTLSLMLVSIKPSLIGNQQNVARIALRY